MFVPVEAVGAVGVPVNAGEDVDALLLKVVQSLELKAPRFVAEAVGTFNVITGEVVELATLLLKSVPDVPNVNADTLTTVPEPLLLNVFQSVLLKYPSVLVVACVIDSVLFALKSPPPDNGEVVEMLRVVSTLVVFKWSNASSTLVPVTPLSFTTCDAFKCWCCHFAGDPP